MKAEQFIWTREGGWTGSFPGSLADSAHLILVFGATALLRETKIVGEIRDAYPSGYVLGCSTAGEIAGTRVLDDSVVVTAGDGRGSDMPHLTTRSGPTMDVA